MLLDRKEIIAAMKNEAFARCRYELFAEQAEAQGLMYFARVLRETADNELSHFREFMRILGQVGDTEANIKTAIADETAEAEDMYPKLAQHAMADGELNTARLFERIAGIEKRHKERLERMAALLKDGSVYERSESVEWKCCVCGYVIEGTKPPKKCPACQNGGEFYVPEDFSF